ncbi:TBC1 domain family member 12 [Chanos chanos]|uniref:TBC1 domain family member 12 n=1 Tax=Chanos chanos TaxID=29144 RepID=A0A6J2WDB2_CHACN|nr:TBC1 domain family member 12-like [Chanos chanos]
MEIADNGESVLALRVDVNENEKLCKSYTSLSDPEIADAPPRLLNEDCSQAYTVEESAKEGKGYVYISSNGRNVNSAGTELQVEKSIMLDLVPDCSTQASDSCVILEQCGDGMHNGFPKLAMDFIVASQTKGVEGYGAIPSSPVADASSERLGGGNGMLPPAQVTGAVELRKRAGETQDSTGDRLIEGHLNSEQRPKSVAPVSALSCVGKHQLNCSCPASPAEGMIMSNGDANCVQIGHFQIPKASADCTYGYFSLAKQLPQDVKLPNGGLLIVNKGTLCDIKSDLSPGAVEGLSDGGSRAFIHHIRCSPESCENSSRDSWHLSAEAMPSEVPPDCGPEDSVSELSAKLSMSSLAGQTSDSTETGSSVREDLSESGFALRPQSLRTVPGCTGSLSCDATPFSPDSEDRYFGAEGDMDAILASRKSFEACRRQSAPDTLPDGHSIDPDSLSDQRVTTKKHGIAEFLSRSLFSWKQNETKTTQSAQGWKLFGRRENPPKDSRTIHQDSEARVGPGTEPHPHPQPTRRKNLDFEPLSTTALILEDRPANLPAKSEEEAQRHRQEYNEMVAGAKRRELKEAQRKKRQMKERYRHEENIANAMVIWNTEVLPNWESMRNTRRVRDLWWQGVPPSVRGKVWSLAIGNELNITPELYEIFLSRAKEKWKSYSETGSENETEDCGASQADRESSLDLIKLDISRTFPSLYIFQKGGPYHDILHSVLGAYTCYRPDVGYVQGMSFIAAVLILNLEEADAFITFANLLNKPCQMAFFRVDHDLMLKYFAAFEVFFEENLPKLFQHFQSSSLTPDLYLIDWIFTLYSKSLPLDVACRVWDVFCRDGEEALFRTGLGILRLYQDVLLQMDFIHGAQFLSRLPENTSAQALFTCIANTQMISGNRRWTQVFTTLMKDGIKDTEKNNSPALRS